MIYQDVSEFDREIAYQNLSQNQREFLDNHIKRGRSTVWLNVLAKHKGAHLTSEELEDNYDELSKHLDWELIERIDHGERTKDAQCMCGASLRYQYFVLNHKTSEITSFGQTCLHNHLDLPIKVVNEVIKGIREIDLERKEILDRIVQRWKLGFSLEGLDVPEQIQKQLDVDLPLLRRQEARLSRLYREKREKERVEVQAKIREENIKRFGSEDPFGTRTSYSRAYQPYRTIQRTELARAEEPKPKADYLHPDTMSMIISEMIQGNGNTTMIQRLLSGLLYCKANPYEFDVDLITEAKDAARVMLDMTNEKSMGRWLVEIENL